MIIPCVLIYIGIIIFSIHRGVFQEMIPTLLIIGIVYALLPMLPYLLAKMSMRSAIKENDGQLPETIITFGDKIELFEGMMHFTIEYRKIVGVRRLAHSYALMTGKRTAVLLRENAFSKGTFEEFKAFLREKYPDMYVPE